MISKEREKKTIEGLGNEYFYDDGKLMKIIVTGKKSNGLELLQVEEVRFN